MKSAKEQFIEWWNGEEETEVPPDHVAPTVRDGGEAYMPNVRTAKEKFAEDIARRFAFDPAKHREGGF